MGSEHDRGGGKAFENTLRSVERPGAQPHPSSPERKAASVAPIAIGRYTLGQEVARGPSSTVVHAFDAQLQRPVALKILHADLAADPDLRHRFVENAKATAELDHPGILPVHEIGDLPDGRVFVAMKLLAGKSLATVLEDVAARRPPLHSWNSLLLRFLRVCETVSFAHARGVIHRDLRPAHVLLGDFGEAYVLDWGLFKWSPSQHLLREVMGGGEAQRRRGKAIGKRASARAEPSSPELMRLSANLPFMSPEQVNADGLDIRSDVYGLGAILCAMACGEAPVEPDVDEAVGDLLARVRSAPRLPPSARHTPGRGQARVPWAAPPAIDAICARALATRREARYPSVAALIDDVTACIEAAVPRASGGPESKPAERRAALDGFKHALFARESAQSTLVELARKVAPWEDNARRREYRELLARLPTLETEEAVRFAEATTVLETAVAQTREPAAQRDLAELYFARYQQARMLRDQPRCAYFRSKVLQHDVGGTFAPALDGVGSIAVRARAGGWIQLHRYIGKDLRLTTELLAKGSGSLLEQNLAPGAYLVAAPHMRVPLALEPGARVTLTLREVQPAAGFAHVEEGVFLAGGDPQLHAGLLPAPVQVRGFEMSIHPITNEAYLWWLTSLPRAARARHVPRRSPQGPALWDVDNLRLPDDPMFAPQAPVVFVSARDATLFCADHGWRLPAELEWEKAGRGVDGRLFPWGDHFDPSFCSMSESGPMLAPTAVGAFPLDESPYGICDMAGGVREWTSSEAPGSTQVVRGGAWNLPAYACRLSHREARSPEEVASNLGFRAARDAK